MSEYGWDISQVFEKTLYQLEHLSAAISRRKRDDIISLANTIRASQASTEGFTQFIADLNNVS